MIASSRIFRQRFSRLWVVTGFCTVLLGSASFPSLAQPELIAQTDSRSPESVEGKLSPTSAVFEEGDSYYEVHRFEGSADEILSIELTSSDFDAFLILLNPSGEMLAQNDDGAGGTNARIVMALPDTGTYTVIANSDGAGEIGDYRLEWRNATATEQDLLQASQLSEQVTELYQARRYTEAISFAERALAIREAALGADHPDTATSLNNLAVLYESQGRYAEAEQPYKRALAIRESGLGPDHPDTARSLNDLALLSVSQGHYGEAEPLLQRAFAIAESVLGPDHPDTATSLNNLAGLYWLQGRDGEAIAASVSSPVSV